MSAFGAIRRRLGADAGVGAIADGRVYPVASPQGEPYPHVLYMMVAQDPLASHSGRSERRKSRYQVTSVAMTYTEAMRLADAIDAALTGRWQDEDEGEVVGVPINRLDIYDEAIGAFRVPADYYIWATDAVPA